MLWCWDPSWLLPHSRLVLVCTVEIGYQFFPLVFSWVTWTCEETSWPFSVDSHWLQDHHNSFLSPCLYLSWYKLSPFLSIGTRQYHSWPLDDGIIGTEGSDLYEHFVSVDGVGHVLHDLITSSGSNGIQAFCSYSMMNWMESLLFFRQIWHSSNLLDLCCYIKDKSVMHIAHLL